MVRTTQRSGESGTLAAYKNTITIAATAVAVTAGATCTASFAGAAVGDVVAISPRAALAAGFAVAYASVLAANVVTIGFINVAANATVPAGTWDCSVRKY